VTVSLKLPSGFSTTPGGKWEESYPTPGTGVIIISYVGTEGLTNVPAPIDTSAVKVSIGDKSQFSAFPQEFACNLHWVKM
jgi:hypothetical protein